MSVEANKARVRRIFDERGAHGRAGVSDRWEIVDEMGMMQQLGVLPTAPAPG
jgi:hypothetical protein